MRTFALVLLLCAVSRAEDIDADRKWAAGTHRLNEPLCVVKDGVTVDFGKAVFEGAPEGTDPDRFTGIGLIVEGRKNVTIRGGRFRGFKCAILVKDCEGVVLEEVDASGNFRQHLLSTPEREDTRDWLRPHDNDKQEWRKNYGAGICLENCSVCTVRACVGRRQQNGLILDRCENCRVYDNDFSFNSGWGCALWRSSRNVVCRNSLDWCVRGYSHGVYDRGQDSAGILVFEQCRDNVFYFNSATHGGDGFFLYAGNETLRRTGEGGCNGNLLLNNDFSHAVANAIEATFSRGNRFVGNRCDDSNYGVWAGYSYDTLIEGNQFGDNTYAGVAIEHGRDNRIVFNTFARNPRGVWLWWDDDKDLLASVFGKAHGGLSRGYLIARNSFSGDKTGVFLRGTADVELAGNHFEAVGKVLATEGDCPRVRREPAGGADVHGTKYDLAGWPGERHPLLPADHPRGRKWIMVDEWGPIDPTGRAVFPREVVAWGACAFHVLGADGVGYEVRDLTPGLRVLERSRTLRITGGDGLTPFTATVVAGDREFPIRGIVLNAKWTIRHWKWENDPREDAGAWSALLKTKPASEIESDRLDYVWGHKGPGGDVPADGFATYATTTMKLPAGRYELRTVSDDGVRVRVDGEVAQEDWTWHGPTEHRTTIDLAAGAHTFVVEHFELDGYAVLRFDLRPVKAK